MTRRPLMKKRKPTTSPAFPATPGLPPVQQASGGLLLALAVALPLIGGKLADWQTGLVALGAVLAAGLLVAGRLAQAERSGGRPRPEDWALAALLALLAASVGWAPYVHGAVLAVLQVLSYALCFWVSRAVFGERRWGEVLAGALALGGSVVALLGLREYLATWRPGGASEWRVFATFFNPNLVAGYLLVCLPAAVALAGRYCRREPVRAGADRLPAPSGRGNRTGKSGGRRSGGPTEHLARAPGAGHWQRPLALAAVVLMALALPLTGSKGGALAALAAAITFGWAYAPAGTASGRRVRRWVLVCVAGVVALGLLAPPLRSRVVAAFGTQSNSTMFRYHTWEGMVRMIGARPWHGFGAGSFVLTYPLFARTGFTRLGHQSYLQIATEAGLPALAAFLMLWILLVRSLRKRLEGASAPCPSLSTGEQEGAVRLLPCAALAALVGFLVHNLVDYSWYCPAVTASLFLLLGAASAERNADRKAAAPSSRRQAYPILAALAALTLALAMFLAAQAYQSAARAALQAGDGGGAIRHTEAALRADPWDAEAWELLSDAWRYRSQTQGGNLSDLQRAIDARQQAARLRRPDPTNWRRLGLLYAEAGHPEAGVDALTEALKYNPNYVLGLADLARLNEQAGKLDAAAAAWERLSALYESPIRKYAALEHPDPTYLFAWDYLARRAESRGEDAVALGYRRKMAPLLEQILTLPPWEITLLQSVALIRTGDLEAFRLMADQTAAALRATGESADAEAARSLDQARGRG